MVAVVDNVVLSSAAEAVVEAPEVVEVVTAVGGTLAVLLVSDGDDGVGKVVVVTDVVDNEPVLVRVVLASRVDDGSPDGVVLSSSAGDGEVTPSETVVVPGVFVVVDNPSETVVVGVVLVAVPDEVVVVAIVVDVPRTVGPETEGCDETDEVVVPPDCAVVVSSERGDVLSSESEVVLVSADGPVVIAEVRVELEREVEVTSVVIACVVVSDVVLGAPSESVVPVVSLGATVVVTPAVEVSSASVNEVVLDAGTDCPVVDIVVVKDVDEPPTLVIICPVVLGVVLKSVGISTDVDSVADAVVEAGATADDVVLTP